MDQFTEWRPSQQMTYTGIFSIKRFIYYYLLFYLGFLSFPSVSFRFVSFVGFVSQSTVSFRFVKYSFVSFRFAKYSKQ